MTTQEAQARFGCKVEGCKKIDPYTVLDQIWYSLGLRRTDNLCLAHLAQRIQGMLGRPCSIDDFTSAVINDPIRFGFRLGQAAARKENVP